MDSLDIRLFSSERRDHSVADGLEYVATWNAGMLHSADFAEVFAALKEKRKPIFAKL